MHTILLEQDFFGKQTDPRGTEGNDSFLVDTQRRTDSGQNQRKKDKTMLFFRFMIVSHYLQQTPSPASFAMNVQKRNGVSIYCLSNGPTLPEWLGERARRNLSKKDEAIRRRIELIQDFQMPASSSRLVQSVDGRYIMAAGTYPPRIRCFDVHELTMKFERYTNSEVMDMVMLGEDYGKMALLQEDRTVSFHANYGAHESIRIPTFGRAMAYEPTTCELLIAAKGHNIFRVNLEEGRFSEPWTYDPASSAANTDTAISSSCIAVNPAYPVACVGCDDGMVRFWDNRTPDALRPMVKLDVQSATKGYGYAVSDDMPLRQRNLHEISAVTYDTTGMYMAAGTTGGVVALYDVRSSKPLYIQEHKHGLAINTLRFHSGSGMILSADEKLLKVWRYKAQSDATMATRTSKHIADETSSDDGALGSLCVNIETTGKISHFIVAGDQKDARGEQSGVILCATDQPKMESYYVPAIGVAPRWYSFLESITEELVERDLSRDGAAGTMANGEEAVYENYKFVSRDDLEQLGVAHLIGTPLLRGYMHGFFMDINLYNRVKAVANPFEYEEYRKKKIKERLEAKRASRIAVRDESKSKAAVNPELAERLEAKASSTTKSGKVAGNVLSDERFGGLFTNPDYQIDEEDENFKLRNPSGVAAVNRKKNNLDSDDEDDEVDISSNDEGESDDDDRGIGAEMNDEDSMDDENDASSNDSDSDDDGFRGAKVRGEAYERMKALNSPKRKRDIKSNKAPKKRSLVMKEADDLEGALTPDTRSSRATKKAAQQSLPLSKRLALEAEEETMGEIRLKGGSKEVSYIPRDAKNKMKPKDDEERGRRQRRGMKDLKVRR